MAWTANPQLKRIMSSGTVGRMKIKFLSDDGNTWKATHLYCKLTLNTWCWQDTIAWQSLTFCLCKWKKKNNPFGLETTWNSLPNVSLHVNQEKNSVILIAYNVSSEPRILIFTEYFPLFQKGACNVILTYSSATVLSFLVTVIYLSNCHSSVTQESRWGLNRVDSLWATRTHPYIVWVV